MRYKKGTYGVMLYVSFILLNSDTFFYFARLPMFFTADREICGTNSKAASMVV